MNPATWKALRWAILPMLGIIAWGVWQYLPRRAAAEVRLAPRSAQAVARFALPAEPIYLQTDPRWANESIGGSGEPLRAVGCTVCCLSMSLAQHGVSLDPAQLNRKLKEAGGYTERGWVKWDAIRTIAGEAARVEIPPNPTHADIDNALAAGTPVLVKVYIGLGVQHWVLVVGRDQNEYLMKDPLGDGKTFERLSSLKSDIYAVRMVRKR